MAFPVLLESSPQGQTLQDPADEQSSFTHPLSLQELTARGRNAGQWDYTLRFCLQTQPELGLFKDLIPV